MKETKIIYRCDICGKEVTKETQLHSTEIPYKSSDCEGRLHYTSYKKVDMCLACRDRYEKVIFDNFGIYREFLGSYSFEEKGDKEDERI